MKKRLLSGIRPTGAPHLGNYFGAMRQFVDMQNSGEYETIFMIADYHALNYVRDAEVLKENIINLAIDYLAIGIDPSKSIIFKQSDVSAHTELAWIFETITTVPYLMRAHAFKDAEGKNREIDVGTFNYPMLMSADILLYDTDVVPVGQDQKQHIEYARDTAQKFNNIYGKGEEIFKMPEDLIIENVNVVPGTDGQKMSKSYKNTIPLFATREEIQKAVMSIVTDSGVSAGGEGGQNGQSDGIPKNVYAIHKLFKTEAELKPLYEANKGKYKPLKDALVEDIDAFIAPLRTKRAEIARDINTIEKMLSDGGKKAREIADQKMSLVKRVVGVGGSTSK